MSTSCYAKWLNCTVVKFFFIHNITKPYLTHIYMVHFHSDNGHCYLDNVLRAIFINLRMMAEEAEDVLSNEFDKATSISLTKVIFYLYIFYTYLWPFSKSKINLKSDRINLVAPACPIECLLYPMQCQSDTVQLLRSERLTRLGNSNVLRLPVFNQLNKKYPQI